MNIKNDRAAWLQGPSATCSALPENLDRTWRMVLLGAPGVGKGTQAEMFSHRLGGCHLSTGDVFRAAASPCNRTRTPAIVAALHSMRCGELVPDATVWEIIRERACCIRCCGGFVLDGFPRTVSQAQAFHQLLKGEGISLDAVVNYELPMSTILSRLGGRRVCEKCKALFHQTERPPKTPGVCDHCGGHLVQREDDRPESVAIRQETYLRDTAPLIKFYRDMGLLVPVSAEGSPEEVFARSLAALETALTDGALRSRNPHDAMIGLHGRRADAPDHKDPL